MSRKREAQRQKRIAQRKAEGTYEMGVVGRDKWEMVVRIAHEGNGKPAVVKPYKKGFALIGGAGGKGKIVAQIDAPAPNGCIAFDRIRAICETAIAGGYTIQDSDWMEQV